MEFYVVSTILQHNENDCEFVYFKIYTCIIVVNRGQKFCVFVTILYPSFLIENKVLYNSGIVNVKRVKQ